MNPFIKIYALVIIFLVNSISLLAHSPYEISYEIKANQSHPTLTVHLTPKTALDLISHLKPELANQAVIKLTDYTKEYAQYFNENLLLLGDGQKASFIFKSANLGQHDATLEFAIDQFPALASKFEVTANCFTDLYRKPQNIIKLQLQSGHQTFYLTKENRQCTTSVKVVAANTQITNMLWLTGLLILVGFAIYLFKRTEESKFFIDSLRKV